MGGRPRIVSFTSRLEVQFLAWRCFMPFLIRCNFVYQRPRYLWIRKDYPEAGCIGAFCCILRFSYRPDPKRWKDQHIRAQSCADSIGSEGERESAGHYLFAQCRWSWDSYTLKWCTGEDWEKISLAGCSPHWFRKSTLRQKLLSWMIFFLQIRNTREKADYSTFSVSTPHIRGVPRN
jgi:hypothetical protein